MPTTYDEASANFERLLYSPHKALGAVLELSAVPKRLFRIFYPLWRVKIEGRQRIATDFEELEWFMERGIHEGGLTSVAALADFFGLERRFVRKLVDFLRAIGHIRGDYDRLALTQVGQESVRAKVRYQEQATSAWLYFDGLDSRPLTLEHYAIPVYDDLSINDSFQAFYQFDRQWDDISLQQLKEHPDRAKFNVPEEITHIDRPLARESLYMPVYVVELYDTVLPEDHGFLAFSRIRSMRDTVLEAVINVDFLTLGALQRQGQGDMEWAVKDNLERRGLREDEWYLQPHGVHTPWGAQVMVEGAAIHRLSRQAAADSESRTLTVRDVGGYLLAYDWCVWLTCDDVEVRQEAAVARLLEWLQFVTALSTAADLTRRLQQMTERLDIPPLAPDTLIEAAESQGFARALERLDGVDM